MNIKENVLLKNFTTMNIGGNARYFCDVNNEQDLLDVIDFAQNKKLPFFVLGGGSNILVSDSGFSGVVIHMNMKGISYEKDENKTIVTAGAGELWDYLVKDTVEKKLFGLENLSSIPGTVGAAPVQNIGAYGSEVKDSIVLVRVFDAEAKKFRDLLNIECGFDYRMSIFKKQKYKHLIITAVSFCLLNEGRLNTEYKDIKTYLESKKIKNPSLLDVRNAVIEIRKGKFPDLNVFGTAGSFFKNPIIKKIEHDELVKNFPLVPSFPTPDGRVKVSLAWILDNVCGLKGFKKGNVELFNKQPLVLVNLSNASSEEIQSFAKEVATIVKDRVNISIEPEVEYIPN